MNLGALSVVFKFKSNGRLRFKSEHIAREGLISLGLWDADLDSNMSETLDGDSEIQASGTLTNRTRGVNTCWCS